jgi:hypothetical protein
MILGTPNLNIDAIVYIIIEKGIVTLNLLILKINFYRHHLNTKRLIIRDFNAYNKS